MDSENVILNKIKQQLELVRGQFNTAQLDLNALVASLIESIGVNLRSYVYENIRREIRKSPDAAEALTDEQFESLRIELNEALEPEMERIVRELRESSAWLEEETAFLDLNSKVWKTVKSVEPAANEVLKRYKLSPVNMKNWAWLSPEIDALITMRFPAAKKDFVDRRKQLKYLENRYIEETRIGNVLNRLESL
ncbi:MAG: hypothetical protein WCX65_02845 [bacterium]